MPNPSCKRQGLNGHATISNSSDDNLHRAQNQQIFLYKETFARRYFKSNFKFTRILNNNTLCSSSITTSHLTDTRVQKKGEKGRYPKVCRSSQTVRSCKQTRTGNMAQQTDLRTCAYAALFGPCTPSRKKLVGSSKQSPLSRYLPTVSITDAQITDARSCGRACRHTQPCALGVQLA